MPFVRIDLNKDAPAERVRIGSQAVYGAMIETADVPINDKVEIEGLGTLVNPMGDGV
jgi:4-oxalocrotonate tautomerase